MPKFPKGSQEAKDYMASIRAKRGTKPKCPCGKSKRKCCCMSGGAIDMPIPPPLPPPPPPSINRVQGFNLDRSVIADPRVRRIMEITQMLFSGISAGGQVLSQQQTETLVAERAELERQVSQANQPAPAQQGQGVSQSRQIVPEIPRPPVPPPHTKRDYMISKWIEIMNNWSDDELKDDVKDSYNKMLAKDIIKARRERAVSGKGQGRSRVQPLMNMTDDDKRLFKYYYKIVNPNATDDSIDKIIEKGMTQKQFMAMLNKGARTEQDNNPFTRTASRVGDFVSTQTSNLGDILDRSGRGIGSSKGKVAPYIPSNTIQNVEVMEYDDRVGSTERIPSAVAVTDDAPMASSMLMSDIQIEKKIKELQKRLNVAIDGRRMTENRIRRTRFMEDGGFSSYGEQELLDEIDTEIYHLTSRIEDLINQLSPSPITAVVTGMGMKKKKQKN